MKEKNTCYVYRHVRLDTNETFYIGIGSDIFIKRAYSRKSRNKYWMNITNKTKYKVEIISESLSWKNACKEVELIKFYGRRSLKQGTLVNLTDEGEGSINRPYKTSWQWKNKFSRN